MVMEMKIEIDDEIVVKLKERIKKTSEFKDVEKYIVYILEQVTNRLEKENTPSLSLEVNENMKKEEMAKRLKSLGY